MDTEALPMELTLALDKANRSNERAVRQAGYGASDQALWLTQGHLKAVSDYIKDDLQKKSINSSVAEAKVIIGQLDPDIIALCALNTVLHGVAVEQKFTALCINLGINIAAECWAAGLTKHDPKLAARVERWSRERHYSAKARRQAARSIATRAGYTLDTWTKDRSAHAGNWLVNCVCEACPGMFELVDNEDGSYSLTLAEGARVAAEQAVGEVIKRHPVSLPTLVPPSAWTSYRMMHEDPRVSFEKTFVRTFHKDVIATCKAAIADGSMKPALDAVSSLQAVPWRINKRVYGVMRGVIQRGLEVKGLPSTKDIPEPTKDKPWAEMSEHERTLWKIERDEAELENRANNCERLLLSMDMRTAEYLHDQERFWTALNCDWRGRIYSLPHFSFARDDRVRALFEFADGMPIGEDGLRWLKMHVANTGDFDKISKASIEERIKWAEDHAELIEDTATAPLAQRLWMQADKPFLFLAACMELSSAMKIGPSFVTHLPVSFDGSCSGLQHLSAMTRDEHTAALVNLTDNGKPSDVYSVIADAVIERLQNDTDELAKKTLAYLGDDKKKQRKLAKRNVMTYAYSSKKFGMAAQQQTDTMDELQRDVLRKKLPEHPFAPSHKGTTEKPGRAARFIASNVFDAIEARIQRPAQAMKFLQSLAKVLAHEGKPVRWTTPTGMPWINRYHPAQLMRLRLWMHDRSIRSYVAVGCEKEIDKDRAANGIAPNFVHALDASHLMLTVNRSVAEGIHSIATVHDSFGCLAPQAATFNKIIREELIGMYERHDVLAEILEQSRRDLTQHTVHKLPSVIEQGTLNLGEIANAKYSFA